MSTGLGTWKYSAKYSSPARRAGKVAENKHLGARSFLSLPVTHVLLFRCYPRLWAQHTHPHLEAPRDTGHSQQLGCA